MKYSRNKSKYAAPQRYGKLHIRYHILFKIIDALEELGYLEQKIGFLDREKNLGRETRMWPTAKMTALFQDIEIGAPKVIHKSQPEEIIQLKDEEKILMDYEDKRSIRDMRDNLYRLQRVHRTPVVSAWWPRMMSRSTTGPCGSCNSAS